MSKNIISAFRSDNQLLQTTEETSHNLITKLMLDIQQQITSSLPQIQWVDVDFKQEEGEMRPSLLFPAVLISLPNIDYSDISSGGTFDSISIDMRLLTIPMGDTYADAPIDTRQRALQFCSLEQQLIDVIHNWTPSPNDIQPLTIRSAKTYRADNKLLIRSLSFTSAF